MSTTASLRRVALRAPTKPVLRALLRSFDNENTVSVAVLGVLPSGLLVTQSGAPLMVE